MSASSGPAVPPLTSAGVAALDPETRPDPSGDCRNTGLLQQGDALFASGSYQAAIHVWTRILFLDRGNAEARLRIERAEALIAERHRGLDLQIAEAGRLFESGAVEEARRIVRSVLASDASHPEAMKLQSRIDALDRRADPPSPPSGAADGLEAAPPVASRGVVFRVPRSKASPSSSGGAASRLQMGAFLLGSALLFGLAAFTLHENWESLVSDGAFRHPAAFEPHLPVRESPPLPDASELRYYNGVRWFAQGRYREALSELGRVDPASSVAADARRLMVRIEERLLRGASDPEPATR